ncbi:MAG: hypothetical protein HY553_17660 [Elusimicrobia bacterium]|nr:hypothetical protein [Elusimicrobiota bacterium]
MSSVGRLALLAALLLASCDGGQGTSGRPSPSPESDACARVALSRDWTTEQSYTRGSVPRGDGIQLGLSGRVRDTAVRATVKAPDGSELSTLKTQEQHRGDEARYVVRYPADFTPAGTTGVLGIATPGSYAVLWEVNGSVAACDAFEVTPTGVADAQSCTPAGWSALDPGSTLVLRSGTATMSIAGDQHLLGVVGDPWYAFEPNDRQNLTLGDGSNVAVIVSRGSTPRRVAARFGVGQVPFRFDASADALPDLVERARAFIACAQQKLAGASSGQTAQPTPAPTTPRPTIARTPTPASGPCAGAGDPASTGLEGIVRYVSDPIPGIPVEIWIDGVRRASATTGRDGRYRVLGLPVSGLVSVYPRLELTDYIGVHVQGEMTVHTNAVTRTCGGAIAAVPDLILVWHMGQAITPVQMFGTIPPGHTTISWSHIPGATSYRVHLEASDEFRRSCPMASLSADTAVPFTSYVTPSLVAGRYYGFVVRAFAGTEITGEGERCFGVQ